jgi:hypothetical protein
MMKEKSPVDCTSTKIVNPLTCALMPPFYREMKGLLHPYNTLELKEYS